MPLSTTLAPTGPTPAENDIAQQSDNVFDAPAPYQSEATSRGIARSECDALTLSYLPFVRSLAGRVYETLPPGAGVELGDLIQAGIVGLVHAAKCYDRTAGVPFSLHAKYRIKGEILDTLRGLDAAPRQLRRFEKRLQAVARDLTIRLGRQPSEEEVLDTLGLDPEEARKKSSLLASIRAACKSDESLPEVPTHRASHPDSICARKEGRRWLGRAIHHLSCRQKQLIWLYYSGEYTMREIGRMMRVNESRVSQLHKGALETMAKRLRESGIRSIADFEA